MDLLSAYLIRCEVRSCCSKSKGSSRLLADADLGDLSVRLQVIRRTSRGGTVFRSRSRKHERTLMPWPFRYGRFGYVIGLGIWVRSVRVRMMHRMDDAPAPLAAAPPAEPPAAAPERPSARLRPKPLSRCMALRLVYGNPSANGLASMQ